MDDIFTLFYGIVANNYASADKVGKTEINGYIVDTCDTNDYGWETAIRYENHAWVIVERYADKENAKVGHDKWVEFCKSDPTEVYSVQLDTVCKLGRATK